MKKAICVGCEVEIWWNGTETPICKMCSSDPAKAIILARRRAVSDTRDRLKKAFHRMTQAKSH